MGLEARARAEAQVHSWDVIVHGMLSSYEEASGRRRTTTAARSASAECSHRGDRDAGEAG